MNHKKAFTLIELLVVIAIIALLLSILLPSLATVKQLASSVVCGSNQKQILTAWQMYAIDNDSKVCGSWTLDYDPASNNIGPWTSDWVESVGTPTTVEQKISGTNPGATTGNQGIKGGSLYSYYEEPKLLHCPIDKRYRKPPTNPGFSGDGAYRTYSFVIQSNGGWNPLYLNYGWVLSQNEMFTKTTEISNPSSKYILVEENDNRNYNDGPWTMDLRPANLGLIDPLAVFHNMRTTLGFADGHAEKMVWKDKRTQEYSESFDSGRTVFSSGPMLDNVDFQWLRNNYAKKR